MTILKGNRRKEDNNLLKEGIRAAARTRVTPVRARINEERNRATEAVATQSAEAFASSRRTVGTIFTRQGSRTGSKPYVLQPYLNNKPDDARSAARKAAIAREKQARQDPIRLSPIYESVKPKVRPALAARGIYPTGIKPAKVRTAVASAHNDPWYIPGRDTINSPIRGVVRSVVRGIVKVKLNYYDSMANSYHDLVPIPGAEMTDLEGKYYDIIIKLLFEKKYGNRTHTKIRRFMKNYPMPVWLIHPTAWWREPNGLETYMKLWDKNSSSRILPPSNVYLTHDEYKYYTEILKDLDAGNIDDENEIENTMMTNPQPNIRPPNFWTVSVEIFEKHYYSNAIEYCLNIISNFLPTLNGDPDSIGGLKLKLVKDN